ncbi:hypothetical protein NDU88_004397 [Pleurodeles waltl]|uniref:Uncharacterized protein n=1 Tax=Pleurodeles waltl TaxID=8319 RepID=A0AAV7T7I9_PLEWA|nr:hypothetical protein NDU88_004397 [Pleurodeles waltl]
MLPLAEHRCAAKFLQHELGTARVARRDGRRDVLLVSSHHPGESLIDPGVPLTLASPSNVDWSPGGRGLLLPAGIGLFRGTDVLLEPLVGRRKLKTLGRGDSLLRRLGPERGSLSCAATSGPLQSVCGGDGS